MRQYEITFESVNCAAVAKRIVALAIEPDRIGPRTGAMLFTHGWGNNRFQDVAKMQAAVDVYDLVCVSVEFRQSGYDFDATRGTGWDCPYDLSFYQVFDVLNGLRQVLAVRPGICRQRLFHYGGSQGGHLAMLGAVFAPKTFAAVYSSCGAAFVDDHFLAWAGREFLPHELLVRNVLGLADRITCPVFLDHGTADVDVDCNRHTRAMEARLKVLGKAVTATYYEGAGHMLTPVTSRIEAFGAMASRFLPHLQNDAQDDFAAGSTVTIPCADRRLVIDWGQPIAEAKLFHWEKTGAV